MVAILPGILAQAWQVVKVHHIGPRRCILLGGCYLNAHSQQNVEGKGVSYQDGDNLTFIPFRQLTT